MSLSNERGGGFAIADLGLGSIWFLGLISFMVLVLGNLLFRYSWRSILLGDVHLWSREVKETLLFLFDTSFRYLRSRFSLCGVKTEGVCSNRQKLRHKQNEQGRIVFKRRGDEESFIDFFRLSFFIFQRTCFLFEILLLYF